MSGGQARAPVLHLTGRSEVESCGELVRARRGARRRSQTEVGVRRDGVVRRFVRGGGRAVAEVAGRDRPVRAVRAVVALDEHGHLAVAGVEPLAEAHVELREVRLAIAVAAEVIAFAGLASGGIGAAERGTV